MNKPRFQAASHVAASSSEDLQVVSFCLQQTTYALDILQVQEIIKKLPVTPVPRTPAWVAGVINLRGQIMPLLDLALCLHLRTVPGQHSERFMILRGTEYPLALMIDSVHEVLRLPLASLESPPVNTLQQEYIQAVCRYQERLVIVLNPQRILAERYHPVIPPEEVA